jgi:N-acetylmuramoyl-L-alanine amidase
MADVLQIDNGRVKGIRFVPATSSGGSLTPTLIVVHDTAGHTKKFSSVDWFSSKACKTSAHFVVELDGTITQMVRTDRRAAHAGVSAWNGRKLCNSFSVGIEVVNPGYLRKVGDEAHLIYKVGGRERIVQRFPISDCVHKKGKVHGDGYWLPYTDTQIASVKSLCRALMEEYPDCNEIVTHWMISPGRKIDTGPHFPLDEVTAYAEGRDDPVEEVPESMPIPPEPAPAPPATTPPPLSTSELAKVSRKIWLLVWLRNAIGSFFALFTFGTMMDTLGYIKGVYDGIHHLAQDNALALGLTTGVLALGVITYLIALGRQDQAKGTWVPSGLVDQMGGVAPFAALGGHTQRSGQRMGEGGPLPAPLEA